MDKLGNTKVFIISKKNSTLNGSKKWKDTIKEFVENTIPGTVPSEKQFVIWICSG